jgi:PPP family 3-phenylpropionic acid transporter
VLWGFWSDRSGDTRRLFAAATGGAALAVLSLMLSTNIWVILPIIAVFAVFNSAIIPQLDTVTLHTLGSQSGHYGLYRMWGTIGFIVTSALAGPILERIGLIYLFPGYALALGIMLLLSRQLPNQPVRLNTPLIHGLREIVRQPAWVLFALSTFVVSAASNGMSNFLGVTIKEMGGADTLVGITWTLGASTEIPFLLFSAALLQRFGPGKLLPFSFCFFALRIFLFGVMPTPEWAPVVNLLHGLSYGLWWFSSVSQARNLAPHQLKATAQGLFVSVISLANMLGALASGWMFDHLGYRTLFFVLAGACVAAVGLYLAGTRIAATQPLEEG